MIVCISLAWGNLAAIVQTNVKRLLAYSSISHAGFLLMPIAAGNALGGRALLYYLIPYAAMSLGAFAVVAVRERELREPVTLANLAGFGWERPFLGASMALFMFGFIGFPPAGIFLGKFYVFSAVIDRGWAWLAIVGVAATAVSVYYYPTSSGRCTCSPASCRGRRGRVAASDRLLVSAVAAAWLVVRSAASSSPTRCSTSPRTRSRFSPSRSARWRSESSSSALGVTGEAFVAALRRLDDKAEITVVENELVGGECSYWACIPSKTLLRSLEVVARARLAPGAAEAVGAVGRLPGLLVARPGGREGRHEPGRVAGQPGRRTREGHGTVGEPGLVAVGDRELPYDALLVATGSRAARAADRGARRDAALGEPRGDERRARFRRAWPSSAAGPSAASWRSATRASAREVTLVQGGEHLLPRHGSRGGGLLAEIFARKASSPLRRRRRKSSGAAADPFRLELDTGSHGGRAAPRRHGPKAERGGLRAGGARGARVEKRGHRRRRAALGRRRSLGGRRRDRRRALHARRQVPGAHRRGERGRAGRARRLPRRSGRRSSPIRRSRSVGKTAGEGAVTSSWQLESVSRTSTYQRPKQPGLVKLFADPERARARRRDGRRARRPASGSASSRWPSARRCPSTCSATRSSRSRPSPRPIYFAARDLTL